MNLTVAAVIDGLASARKDEGALISQDDIDVFIHLWSDYDPKATGWVSVECYVFLLFELPKSIGLGKEIPVPKNLTIDQIYLRRRQQNEVEILMYKNKNADLKTLKDCEDILIVNDEGIFL